jgi:AhpD family alkylhydroperoxidase
MQDIGQFTVDKQSESVKKLKPFDATPMLLFRFKKTPYPLGVMSIRYFSQSQPVTAESFSGKILSGIRREFGAEVEPFTLHLPVPELLAGAWMTCRETLLAGNGRRDAKEVVAAAVSTLNRCSYCIDAHSMMLLGSSGNDYLEALHDPLLQKTAAWAKATRTPDSPLLRKPPFNLEEAPAFIGTAIFFHYINPLVTILLGASPLPFTFGLPKKVSLHMAAWFFGGAIRLQKQPGTSIELLPETTLPDDMLWAHSSQPIAAAFARFTQAVEQAGTRTLSAETRAAVTDTVRKWQGENPPMNNGWCEEAIAHLGIADKTAGRLALLTALAPYKIDKTIVFAFSTHFPGDDKLLSALAWSSFTAARRIGSWL